ncbi:hypothetical protein, partial [Paracoccus niistensis]
MNTLYNVIEAAELKRKAQALIEPSGTPSADPVLGYPPEIVYRWNTFVKKHGTLVENVMTKVIRSHAGWQAASQTRFKCDTDETKKLIDRVAINPKNGVAIFVECKRNLGNVSDPYLKSIIRYNAWCQDKAADIAREIGFTPSNSIVRFAVFNAYGSEDDALKIKGVPVLSPRDLPKIFGQSVLDAFVELNKVVHSVTCHGIFPPPPIRVRPNSRTD